MALDQRGEVLRLPILGLGDRRVGDVAGVGVDPLAQAFAVGDRVAGYLPNVPETVAAMLAASSLGAVWSSCSPDFGVAGVLDRFGQISPKLLLAADGYFYNGQRHSILAKLPDLLVGLPSVVETVIVPYGGGDADLQ